MPHAQSSAATLTSSRERVETDDVDRAAADVHARDSATMVSSAADHRPADERGDRVAEDDPAPVRCREEQPPREPVLEVAGDPEAGEDAAEGGGLEQDEAELEPRVAARVVEARAPCDRESPPAKP